MEQPRYKAYVHFSSGGKTHAGDTNSLSMMDAEKYRQNWKNKGPVTKVTLEDAAGHVLITRRFSK